MVFLQLLSAWGWSPKIRLSMIGNVREYTAGERGEVQLQPKPQAEPDRIPWNEFCGLVLEIISELSPCPEPTLFVIAATRGLQRFGDGTLENLSKLLDHCVQELQARGLVQISQDRLVITPAESTEDQDILELTSPADEDILELTTVAGSPVNEDILVLTAELELQPSLRPSQREEAQTNSEQQQPQAQLSASRKHAAEPTREEIIAAMRRFISEH
jgi:hypothetical protein